MICATRLHAQIPLEASITVFEPYPATYGDWFGQRNGLMVTVVNNSDASFNYFVSIQLQNISTGFYIKITDEYRPPEGFFIAPYSVATLTFDDLEPKYQDLYPDFVESSDPIPNDAVSALTAALPEGEYQLCVELVSLNNPTEKIFLNPLTCSEPFSVTEGDVTLIFPFNESEVPIEAPVQFQWNVNLSDASMIQDLTYDLKIIELDDLIAEEESLIEIFEMGSLPVFWQESGLSMQTFMYDVNLGLPAMQPGRTYAARVKATNLMAGREILNNEGYSNIHTFTYGISDASFGGDGDGTDGNEGDDRRLNCLAKCQPPSPIDQEAISNYSGINAFTIGNFTVEDVTFTNGTSSGPKSGSGFVTIAFLSDLKIQVLFQNVTLNAIQEAITGNVIGQTGPHDLGATAMVANAALNNLPIDPSIVEVLSTAIYSSSVISDALSGDPVTLPFGVVRNMGEQNFTMAITDFKLGVNSSDIDFVHIFSFPALGPNLSFGMAATDVCVSPQGFGGEYTISLPIDITVPMDGGWTLHFAGGDIDNASGAFSIDQPLPCHLEMDCEGIKSLTLSGNIDFPTSILRKENGEGEILPEEQVRGMFTAEFHRSGLESISSLDESAGTQSDFIAGISMDPFQIKGLNGWGFELEEGVLDLSSNHNAEDMYFPEGHTFESETDQNLWHGLFLKNLKIKSPTAFNQGGERSFSHVHNLLIDGTISAEFDGENILPFERGNFKGWAMSIDDLEFRIIQNHFNYARMAGKFGAPVFDPSEHLIYQSVIDESQVDQSDITLQDEDFHYNLTAVVVPNDNIEIPISQATATICNSSYLAMDFSPIPEERQVELFLKGGMDVNLGSTLENVVGRPDFNLADFQLKYNSVRGFLFEEDTQDGTGTYFGSNATDAVNCQELDLSEIQNLFTELVAQASQYGENVFRDIGYFAEPPPVDEPAVIGETDELVSFSGSQLEVTNGIPKLTFEVRLNPPTLDPVEAGIEITANKMESGERYHFGVDNVNLYYNSGAIELLAPVNGADIATTEALNFSWETGIEEQDRLDQITYEIRVALLEEGEDHPTINQRLIDEENLLFKIENLSTQDFILQQTANNFALFTDGNQYATIVKATDANNEPLLNNGYSNVNVFHWGQSTPEEDLAQSSSECAERCAPDLPDNTSQHPNPSGVSDFMMGNFVVTVSEMQQGSGALINGQGTVMLDFLNNVRINVSFTNVQLNTDRQALAGQVSGIEDENLLQMLGGVANYLAGTNSDGSLMQNLSETLQLGRLVSQVAMGGSIGIPFGINYNFGGNSFLVGITDFNLTPQSSDLDFVQIFSFPSLGDQFSFGIGATDICVAPDGFGGELILSMPSDLTLPLDGDLALNIRGGLVQGNAISGLSQEEQNSLPTCLEIDCNGFRALNIAGDVTFPPHLLLKEVDGAVVENELVKAYFNVNYERTSGEDVYGGEGESGNHLLLALQMDDFQIPGLDGWGFTVEEATMDLSSVENPSGIEFPQDFVFEASGMEEAWQGFHLKELSIRPPTRFMADPGQRLEIGIQHLLIDPTLSVDFVAQNLLPFSQGNIKGWGMSIDEFSLSIVQNNFEGGQMLGQFGAPIFQKAGDNLDQDQFLAYEAAITRQEGQGEGTFYQFDAVVRPQEDQVIELPILGATSTVCASSYLGVQIAPGEENTHMEVFLKGNLGIDVGQFLGENAEGEFIIPAADFQMKYNTVKGFVMQDEDPQGLGTTIGVGLLTSDGCAESVADPDFNQLFADLRNDYVVGGNQVDRSLSGGVLEQGEAGDTDVEAMEDENRMNGFPIRLGNFGISLENGAPAVSFTVDLALASGSDGFAAGAGLTLRTAITEGADGKTGFKLDGLDFNCARLACDLQMFKMVGALCYVNDDTQRGYYGRIIADVNGQLTLDLSAGYGTFGSPDGGYAFGTEEYHAAWYADARIEMESGIQMGPVVLNAIGGGIYWNFIPPDLPGHSSLSGVEDEQSSIPGVNETIQDLVNTYGISIPASSAASLGGSPQHDYGRRALKFNAGLSIIRPQLVAIDPSAYVVWTEGEGIDMISIGGYVYVIQDSYLGRGAPAQPATSSGDSDISFDIASSGEGMGSRLWLSGFITLYFDRESAEKTLVAFESSGEVFLNMIPNILYGDMEGQPYKLIDQDILIAHKDHYVVGQRNVDVSRINGSTYWHAYFGNPYDPAVGPGAAAFDLMSAIGGGDEVNGQAGIRATAYFMMGNGIPAELPPVPDDIQRIIEQGSSGADQDNSGSFSGSVDEGAERRGSTTSGLAFGTSVSVQVGFEKIIYAELDVTLGGDILLADFSDFQCSDNGNTYDPPGVGDGFYGLGQIYAGLEGALGIRGKIGPINVDVHIMDLGAGMMLQMGGPNPFWFDGRAGIYYSILGGKIEGNAQVEVSAGDRCYPYESTGFSLDIVDRFYPDENYDRSDPADPLVQPKVTFTMPVAMPDHPESAETTIPSITSTGQTILITFAPVIEEFSVEPTVNNPLSITGNWSISQSKKKITYVPNAALAAADYDRSPKRWKTRLRLKVKEKVNGAWRYMEDYEVDTTVRFWTGPLDPYIENVTHSNPIKGQRFFMKDEWSQAGSEREMVALNAKDGIFKFSNNVRDQRFYIEDENGRECQYFVVVKRASDMAEVSRYQLSTSDIYARKAVFPLPSGLQPSTFYIMQLVRQKEFRLGDNLIYAGTYSMTGEGVSKQVRDQYDVYNDYTIEYEREAINPYGEVGNNETLLHMVVFGTGDYPTIRQKLDQVAVEHIGRQEGCTSTLCPAYDKIEFSHFSEHFEEIELDGLQTVLRDDNGVSIGEYYTPPRVRILDPLEGPLFEGVTPLIVNLSNALQTVAFCPFLHLGNGCNYAQGGVEIDLTTHNSAILSPLWVAGLTMTAIGDPTNTNTFFNIQSGSLVDEIVDFRYDVRQKLFEDVDNLLNIAENYSDQFTNTVMTFSGPKVVGSTGTQTEVRSPLGQAYDALLSWRNDHITYLISFGNNASTLPRISYEPNYLQVIYNTSPVEGGQTTDRQGTTATLSIN